jgi:hypothetical protein
MVQPVLNIQNVSSAKAIKKYRFFRKNFRDNKFKSKILILRHTFHPKNLFQILNFYSIDDVEIGNL